MNIDPSDIIFSEGAEPTNRLIPGDEDFKYPEWSELATTTDGRRVRIYYRTTPKDAELAREFDDWSGVPWEKRITSIEEIDEE